MRFCENLYIVLGKVNYARQIFLEFMKNITDCIDKMEPVCIIYLDFSKAFDKIPHKKLI